MKVNVRMSGAILLVIKGLALSAAPARADEAVGALRMLPNRMFLPSFAAELEVVGTLDGDPPLLAGVAVEARGVPMRRAGGSWGAASASMALDPRDVGDPEAFDARLAVQRRARESNPVVAASDARFGCLRLRRDRALGIDLDGLFEVADWSGGLYMPALFPRDLDARIVVGVRGLGLRWRRFEARGLSQPTDYWGFAIGGLSGEGVYGRKLGEAVVLTGHGGGQVEWSIGSADGLALLTDTEIWAGGALDLGDHHELRLNLSRAVQRDPSHAVASASLSLAWRTMW